MTKKRILLLGDSIRMSYQPKVKELLADTADVCGPEENCQFALYTLSSIDRWLAEFINPDIIHINLCLHDSGHNPKRQPHQLPIDMYIGNLRFILDRLFETKAKVIWATTTPVHPKRPFLRTEWSWRNQEVSEYNAQALDLIKQYNIPVNDLGSIIWSHIDEYLAADMIHLNEKGIEHCAIAVVESIRKYAL
jgi:lysophospholipase L1-like esterase